MDNTLWGNWKLCPGKKNFLMRQKLWTNQAESGNWLTKSICRRSDRLQNCIWTSKREKHILHPQIIKALHFNTKTNTLNPQTTKTDNLHH